MSARARVGIVGAGGIGLACAAWLAQRGHQVTLWSPRGGNAQALRHAPLTATGVLEGTFRVGLADSAQALAEHADVVLIAVPINGHRVVMDALLPHLRSDQLVIVSSMASLSSLHLYERALSRGITPTVASFGTTVLTARRKSPIQVDVMTLRKSLGVACLPQHKSQQVLDVCSELFGTAFTAEGNCLATTLTNTAAIAHVPLALFNWTRIEREEAWPQYHYLTPHVAAFMEKLDAERRAIASAFGLAVPGIAQQLSRSSGVQAAGLAEIAAELHRRRGGPPGPTDVDTRFLSEDVPYGLAFQLALGHVAHVHAPATEATVAMAGLIVGQDLAAANDLIDALRLSSETVEGLRMRVSGNPRQGLPRNNATGRKPATARAPARTDKSPT